MTLYWKQQPPSVWNRYHVVNTIIIKTIINIISIDSTINTVLIWHRQWSEPICSLLLQQKWVKNLSSTNLLNPHSAVMPFAVQIHFCILISCFTSWMIGNKRKQTSWIWNKSHHLKSCGPHKLIWYVKVSGSPATEKFNEMPLKEIWGSGWLFKMRLRLAKSSVMKASALQLKKAIQTNFRSRSKSFMRIAI